MYQNISGSGQFWDLLQLGMSSRLGSSLVVGGAGIAGIGISQSPDIHPGLNHQLMEVQQWVSGSGQFWDFPTGQAFHPGWSLLGYIHPGLNPNRWRFSNKCWRSWNDNRFWFSGQFWNCSNVWCCGGFWDQQMGHFIHPDLKLNRGRVSRECWWGWNH